MSYPRFTTFAAALLVSLLIAGCGNDGGRQRSLTLTPCRLPNLATMAQCGELNVPEDRAKADGRSIRIFAAVLPANTVSPKDDPLLILAGGPGQAASQLAPFAARLTELRRTRDIVIIDQRGTGRSSPLTCAAFKPDENETFEIDLVPRARACVDQLKAQGIDPAQYTTAAWIADLEVMRATLGYTQWNLWGGSYGTRVAQEYVRRHPERVRTLTLDGVVPPGMIVTLDVWRTREAALEAIIAMCGASRACTAAHPDLDATLARIAEALGPEGRDVELIDPRTGATTRQRVTFDIVLGGLQPLLYAPEFATMLPEMLALLEKGDFGPLFSASLSLTGNFAEQLNTALHLSVACTEDAPRIKPEEAAAATTQLRTRNLAQNLLAVCAIWPRGSTPADFAQPVKSNHPALLLSGGMDPVTPPAYGTAVARDLNNSRHVIAPGYGHIVSPHACGPRLVAAFVDAAGFTQLPERCVTYFEKSVPPPLWAGRLEPQP
jgi:pimeloyl-ACP methyl ester carboxylesterase